MNTILLNGEIINHIKTLRDLRLMSSALVSKNKMERLKRKILLEVIDDIVIEYPDTNDFIQ